MAQFLERTSFVFFENVLVNSWDGSFCILQFHLGCWPYQFHCLEYPCPEGMSILFSPNTAWDHPLSKLSKKLTILVRSVWPLLEWIPSPLPHMDYSPDHLSFLASPIRRKDQDNDSVVSSIQGMGITASTHRFLPLPWSYCSRWLELQPPKGDINPLKATSPLVQ